MPSNAYETLHPEEGDPLWTTINRMVAEADKALAALLSAIHDFERGPRDVCSQDRSAGIKIDPKTGYDEDEVYLVPAQYHVSAALLAVEHNARTIRFIKIYERLLPEEEAPAQWAEIVTSARGARAAAKAKR